jgi:hypothetical protein
VREQGVPGSGLACVCVCIRQRCVLQPRRAHESETKPVCRCCVWCCPCVCVCVCVCVWRRSCSWYSMGDLWQVSQGGSNRIMGPLA